MLYRYIGSVSELPTKSNDGDIVLKDNKIYAYIKGWEELATYEVGYDFEIRDAVRKSEGCALKEKLLQIFKKYDDM